MKKALAAAALASLMTLGAPSMASAVSPGGAGYSLAISGFVPVICRAQLDSAPIPSQAGVVPLGQMQELCNNANGYEVWVDYSPTLAGDTLVVDGQQIALTASGSTRIVASSGPNIATRSLALDIPANGVSGSVSIRVVTL
ncbi:MAG: hypothetical protein ACHP7N_02465 [Caulobacterales bacterium]